MHIDKINISQIRPASYNPRKDLKPGDPQYDRLKRSIEMFDIVEPLVWNKRSGNLVGGHQRFKVLAERGDVNFEVSVVDLDDAHEKALNIALNKITGEWDIPKLKELLVGLDDGHFDLDITGFSELELKELIDFEGKEGLTDDDDVPERPKKVVTQNGDVWIMGEHYLVCGSCTDPKVVGAALAGGAPKMIFTDPPWNVAIGKDSNPRHRQREGLRNDDLGEEFEPFLKAWVDACLPYLAGDIYCVMGSGEWPAIDRVLRDAGMHWSGTLVWVKDAFVLGRSQYHRRFEPIWYGWSKKQSSSFVAGRDQDDVWEFPRPRVSADHPTMKPVALVEKAIINSSNRGDIVFDPFLGSGTTLLACEKFGRRCVGIEIAPIFCDVIVKRWENFTGQKAVLKTTEKAYAISAR